MAEHTEPLTQRNHASDMVELSERETFMNNDTLDAAPVGGVRWAGVTVSSIIRLLGAILLVVSASTFMIEQVSDANDVVRYLALLGHTVFLGIAGIFCALKLKESRSARTFFAIVVASVPVHFAVLGGLLYSTVQWDAAYALVQPNMWIAHSRSTAVGLLGLGIVVLSPLLLFSMMSLARKHAKTLTAAFVAGNALLLVPLRHADAVVLLFVAGAAMMYGLEHRYFSRDSALKTVEGRILRFILVTPLFLLFFRTTMYYSGSVWFYSGALTASGVMAFLLAARLHRIGKGVQLVLTPFILVGVMVILNNVFDLDGMDGNRRDWGVIVSSVVVCSVVAILGQLHTGVKSGYYRVALMGGMIFGFAHMALAPSMLTTSVVAAGALVALFGSMRLQQRIPFLTALITMAATVVFHLHGIVHVSAMSHWGVLLAAGVLLLLGASLADRKRDALLSRMRSLKTEFHSWGY
ncbi:MAG: hypothetical protein JXR76_24600 [Deltaproteobacteria bacterium]|nr:hypothetical protein [Deltaproteobacteria bacterium]